MDGISSITSITTSPTGSGIVSPAVRQNSERAVNAAARLFNMRDEDVHKLIAQGSSLADIGQDKGINRGQLVAAVRQAFQSGGNKSDFQKNDDVAKAFVSRRGSAPKKSRK